MLAVGFSVLIARPHAPISYADLWYLLHPAETSKQQPDAPKSKPGERASNRPFEFLRQAKASIRPRNSPLDIPVPSKELESLCRLLDDLNHFRTLRRVQAVPQLLAAISRIRPSQLHHRMKLLQLVENADRAVAILNVGRVNLQDERHVLDIDCEVALAAVDLLAGVVASRAAGLGGFQTPAVDDSRRRLLLATGRQRSIQR